MDSLLTMSSFSGKVAHPCGFEVIELEIVLVEILAMRGSLDVGGLVPVNWPSVKQCAAHKVLWMAWLVDDRPEQDRMC